MNRLIDILGGETRTMIAEAADRKSKAYKILIVALIGGTTFIMLMAMLLAHRVVARPLKQLAAIMRHIAQGDLDVTIKGLRARRRGRRHSSLGACIQG